VVDIGAVADRAGLALIAGVVIAAVGLFVAVSDLPNLLGWALTAVGGMTVQAGLIGYVLSAGTADRNPV
jgi:hypothetical protein